MVTPSIMNTDNYPRNLNPFLEDDDINNSIRSAGSFFSVSSLLDFLPPPPPPRVMSSLKLPTFWADAPVAWFAATKAQFELRYVNNQKERFCHVTAALDKLSLKKIVHLVFNPDHCCPTPS